MCRLRVGIHTHMSYDTVSEMRIRGSYRVVLAVHTRCLLSHNMHTVCHLTSYLCIKMDSFIFPTVGQASLNFSKKPTRVSGLEFPKRRRMPFKTCAYILHLPVLFFLLPIFAFIRMAERKTHLSVNIQHLFVKWLYPYSIKPYSIIICTNKNEREFAIGAGHIWPLFFFSSPPTLAPNGLIMEARHHVQSDIYYIYTVFGLH